MPGESEFITITDIFRRGFTYTIAFSNDVEIRATKGTIDNLNLSVGMAFGEAEFAKIVKILEESFAFYTAESILARRAHSIGEFKHKLRQKEFEPEIIAKIVKEFKKRDLLDDFAYGKLRVNALLARKPAGRAYLVADLQAKLVPREIAESAVQQVLSGTDEVAAARELLEKRRVSFLKFDLETARRKAYTYLSRRAISYPAAKEAFEAVFNKEDFG